VWYCYEPTETRDLSQYGGVARVGPALSAGFLVGVLSSIGLPGTNGFIGEFLILIGTFTSTTPLGNWGSLPRGQVLSVLAATGVILGAVYMLWMVERVIFGPKRRAAEHGMTDLTLREWLTVVPLLPAILLIRASSALASGPRPQGHSERPPGADRRYQAWLAAVFAALGLWAAVAQMGDPAAPLFSGAAVTDGFARVIAAVVCGALVLSCFVSFGYLEALRATRGEYYALALFSASGMCLLGQATDLIVIFISLEVMSLAVYCLSAYLRRGQRPAE